MNYFLLKTHLPVLKNRSYNKKKFSFCIPVFLILFFSHYFCRAQSNFFILYAELTNLYQAGSAAYENLRSNFKPLLNECSLPVSNAADQQLCYLYADAALRLEDYEQSACLLNNLLSKNIGEIRSYYSLKKNIVDVLIASNCAPENYLYEESTNLFTNSFDGFNSSLDDTVINNSHRLMLYLHTTAEIESFHELYSNYNYYYAYGLPAAPALLLNIAVYKAETGDFGGAETIFNGFPGQHDYYKTRLLYRKIENDNNYFLLKRYISDLTAFAGNGLSHARKIFNLGNIFFQQEKYTNAVSCYSRSLDLERLPEAACNLGIAYYQTGDLQKGIYYLNESINIRPGARAFQYLANIEAGLKNYSQAAAYYLSAIDFDPQNYLLYNNLASCLSSREPPDLKNALLTINSAISNAPGEFRFYLTRAEIYTQTGEYEFVFSDLTNSLYIITNKMAAGEQDSLTEMLKNAPEQYTNLDSLTNKIIQKINNVSAVKPRGRGK
ncbi:MAG: hypothetical protein A2096_02320 [Spirochaetes bacterium GWF1_41_5]|nr:MAG: hypothetical protein A2096_02320 [Spirochaetes bacterium GWF1_41_5]HBE01465.1 hypothetical protein [Spirochaetia bacterium]